MKTKFKNISQYLAHKPQCPFCHEELIADVISSLTGAHTISDTELKVDGLHYIFTTLIGSDYETFNVTLRFNGTIAYSRTHFSHHTRQIEKKRFIEAFNYSYPQVSQSCVNRNCKLEFFKESLPLFLDEEGLHSPFLYRESFTFDNYLVQNNYADDVTEVYIKNDSSPPVKMGLYELTEKSTPLIFERIKVALVFS